MRDELFHWQFSAKNQPGGLFLQIHRSAITAEYGTLAHANFRSRSFNSLGGGSLREQQNARPGTRTGNRMIDDSLGRSGYDHDIRAAAFSQPLHFGGHVALQRVPHVGG